MNYGCGDMYLFYGLFFCYCCYVLLEVVDGY